MRNKLLVSIIIIFLLVIIGEISYLFVFRPYFSERSSVSNESLNETSEIDDDIRPSLLPAGGEYGQYADFAVNITGQEFMSEAKSILTFDGTVQEVETTPEGVNLTLAITKNDIHMTFFFPEEDISKATMEEIQGVERTDISLNEISEGDIIKVILDMNLLSAQQAVSTFNEITILKQN